ncbi:MAG: DUF2066 domain-containing protein [Rhodobiaceae bacterium]|nr:DUF2066 domain-containing protein [Rhodobiaceae bacterium]MCC0056486.1 DUF2066 domain-containing protein [Rhodobiaceae bacterium]
MRFSTDSRRFAAGLIVLALAAWMTPATADPFIVREMAIVRHAANASQARDEALAEAPLEALNLMLQRLLPKKQVATLKLRPDAARTAMDRIAVMSETAVGESYSARLTVTFSRERVIRMLAARGIVPVAGTAPPVLVIPVLVEGEVPRLWADARNWHEALTANMPKDAIAPAKLPDNGFGDRSAPVQHVLSGDHMTMEMFRLRYRAQGVVLAAAAPVAGRDRVALRLYGTDAVGDIEMNTEVVGTFDDAARVVFETLSERWKSDGARDNQAGERDVVITGAVASLPGPDEALAGSAKPR